jgi:hypothetical protein
LLLGWLLHLLLLWRWGHLLHCRRLPLLLLLLLYVIAAAPIAWRLLLLLLLRSCIVPACAIAAGAVPALRCAAVAAAVVAAAVAAAVAAVVASAAWSPEGQHVLAAGCRTGLAARHANLEPVGVHGC